MTPNWRQYCLESLSDIDYFLYSTYLNHLLFGGLAHKVSRKTENMLNWSDFSFQPGIDRAFIDELITLRFIHNTENNNVRYACILHICSEACADAEKGL